MEQEPPVQTPNTVEGMSIHFGYIRRDLDSINKKLDGLVNTFVSTHDFEESKKQSEKDRAQLNEQVASLQTENKNRKEFQDTLMGKMWGIGIMAGAFVGVLTIIVNHLWK